MNHFVHPDTFYEHNRQYHEERLKASQRPRPFASPKRTNNNLKDRFFLVSGDLMITFGKNLKSHAAQPVCTRPMRKPQAA
ncbi:MAG: hypothetical protein CL608_16675 [Anaerolineaceae bacterium]|nr:hypothetical protein [Anaerolineaceae bacterium]